MGSRFIFYSCVLLVIAIIAYITLPHALNAGIPSNNLEPLYQQDGKNIQVLKGLPEGHRDKIMDFVAASLGVKCNHCHVIDSTGWHMELDDKPTKRTARKMMQMVLDINAKTFGGRTEVTCFTCHRGSTEPASVLPLPLPPPSPPKREDETAATSLPGVEEILSMAEKALGGEEAMKKITSRVAKGVLVTGDGREIPLEMISQAPDKFISSTTMNNGAQSVRCYNGKIGWMTTPRGTRELSPDQSEDLKLNGSLFPIGRVRQFSKTMHVSKKDSVNGDAAYILEAAANEHTLERYYIGAENGLLLRKVVLTETMIADVPEQTDYADYRSVDGVKVPFTIRSSSADPRDAATRRLTTVEQNVKVDAKKFEMPAKKK